MIGYLHREKTEDRSARTLDVKVDYPKGISFLLGSEFEVTIVDGNDKWAQKAFVAPRYQLFEAEANVDNLGAEILAPEIDPQGVFLQEGTNLTVRLIRLD